MLAIINGYIKTMDGEDIKNGQIIIEDGKIKEVGNNLIIPQGAEIIDAQGLLVTPGLIYAHNHVCMCE